MKNKTFLLILTSIILGFICGIFYPKFMISLSWIGTVFVNSLKLIVMPLVFCALVSAITSMGAMKRLGSIGGYTIAYVLISVTIAGIVGLLLLNIFQPGVGLPPSLILSHASPADLRPIPFSSFLLMLFPSNIIAAAAKFEIMPIVFFSVVFAAACLSVGKEAQPVILFFASLRSVFVKMIVWLMYLTPIGLFSLIGSAIAEASLQHRLMQSIRGVLFFIFILVLGLVIQMLWQLAVLKFIVKRSPKEFVSASSNAMLTAFATSSSVATLPVTLIFARTQNISEEVARFVLPLATTINMAGSVVYEAVSTLFFCQILGMHLSVFSQIGVLFTAILAGMGAAGIPEGGLITLVMVLRCVNVPTGAIMMLLPFERIIDRFRTMTNVWGDMVCAATVDYFVHTKKVKNMALAPQQSVVLEQANSIS